MKIPKCWTEIVYADINISSKTDLEPPPHATLRCGRVYGDYIEVTQQATRHTRWVPCMMINIEGIEIAFYDADPTFRPVID